MNMTGVILRTIHSRHFFQPGDYFPSILVRVDVTLLSGITGASVELFAMVISDFISERCVGQRQCTIDAQWLCTDAERRTIDIGWGRLGYTMVKSRFNLTSRSSDDEHSNSGG
jgi:hypothetical protein